MWLLRMEPQIGNAESCWLRLSAPEPSVPLTQTSGLAKLVHMIRVNMHEAKTRLSELVKAVEERGETVILQRHGRPVAEILAYAGDDEVGAARNLAPDPALKPALAPGFDPSEPLSDAEWPADLR